MSLTSVKLIFCVWKVRIWTVRRLRITVLCVSYVQWKSKSKLTKIWTDEMCYSYEKISYEEPNFVSIIWYFSSVVGWVMPFMLSVIWSISDKIVPWLLFMKTWTKSSSINEMKSITTQRSGEPVGLNRLYWHWWGQRQRSRASRVALSREIIWF